MADSSFDPLGMVKAMGPQRDPYSWAELYAQDASKGRLQQEEMKNRLLIQEMVRAERAREGAADRASRELIAGRHDTAAMERLKKSVQLGLRGAGGGRPIGFKSGKATIPDKDWRRFRRNNPEEAKNYISFNLPGGKTIYHHKDFPLEPVYGTPAAPAPAATAAPANPAAVIPNPDPDEEY